jgi:hypothetical protein
VVLPGAKADAFRRAAIHAAFLMGRDPRKTGFFAFVQFRQLPLQWALPRRFETIPEELSAASTVAGRIEMAGGTEMDR